MQILHLYLSPEHNFFGHHGQPAGTAPMIEVPEAECVAGKGLVGDRFFDWKEDYKGQVTFFEHEQYERLCAKFSVMGVPPSAFRRNIITKGIDLNTLIGVEFEVQGVRFPGHSGMQPLPLDEPGLCRGCGGGAQRSRRFASQGFERWHPAQIMNTPFAAVLLAGGRSTRMKQDKALLDWQGRPLWQVQLNKLQALQPAHLLLSCRREQPLAPLADVEVVFDPENTDDGPLGAITRCLERVQMPLLVLAVDMPWMSVEFLREKLISGGFFHGAHGYETLAGLYTPEMLPLMQAALREQRLALQPVIEACVNTGATVAHGMSRFDTACFHNANTPEDWR